MTMKTPENASTPGPRPYWWPEGVSPEQLPENLRAAVDGIIRPAYEQLVLGARAGLAQSAGATVVSLLWLEILQQSELGQDLMDAGKNAQRLQRQERAIGRLLRLAGAKLKASDFLVRLESHRQKLAVAMVEHESPPATALEGSPPGVQQD